MEKISILLQQINFKDISEDPPATNRFHKSLFTNKDCHKKNTLSIETTGWNFDLHSTMASVAIDGSNKDNSNESTINPMASKNRRKRSKSAVKISATNIETAIATHCDTGWETDSSIYCAPTQIRYNLRRRGSGVLSPSGKKETRRSIVKTPKTKLSTAAIKKIYTNNKVRKFHPANLETIFEEPTTSFGKKPPQNGCLSDIVDFVGAKKLRRSLSFSDGLHPTKSLIKHRRAKIKKKFGHRREFKKIALEEFLARMTAMEEPNHSDEMTSWGITESMGGV